MSRWIAVGRLADIPRGGARAAVVAGVRVALFRTVDDAVHALLDRCPHRGGPLSEGIVHGACVTCPLHNRVIALATGRVLDPEAEDGTVPVIAVRIEDGRLLLDAATLPVPEPAD